MCHLVLLLVRKVEDGEEGELGMCVIVWQDGWARSRTVDRLWVCVWGGSGLFVVVSHPSNI